MGVGAGRVDLSLGNADEQKRPAESLAKPAFGRHLW